MMLIHYAEWLKDGRLNVLFNKMRANQARKMSNNNNDNDD
jgi:hypothetical protein